MKWTRLEQSGNLPLARSSHSITAVGGKCYLFGGEHEPRQAHISFLDIRSTWMPMPSTSKMRMVSCDTGRPLTAGCMSIILQQASGHNAHALAKHQAPGWRTPQQRLGRACTSLAGAQVLRCPDDSLINPVWPSPPLQPLVSQNEAALPHANPLSTSHNQPTCFYCKLRN